MKKKESLRERVKAAAKELGWNAHDIALHTDLAWSTIGRFLGEENYTETALIHDQLERFLVRVKRGDIGGGKRENVVAITAGREARRPRQPRRKRRVYETEVMRKVASVIDLSVENASLSLITAENGAGKTAAVQAWRASHREQETVCFEFDDFTASGKINFLGALAAHLGIEEDVTQGTATRVFRAIVGRLREDPALLIFDQCETARVRILQIIRQIWDRTREEGVAVVMLATPQLLIRLDRGRAGDLGALRSRIGCWEQLAGLRREEMASILKAEGIVVNEATFDLWYRAVNGSMRHLMESVDLLLARHKGKAIGQRTIAGVCRRLMGLSIAAAGRTGGGSWADAETGAETGAK